MKFLIMDRYFSPVTVDVVPSSFSKKYWPNRNPALIPYQTVTRGECSGLSWIWCGFSWLRILEICLLTHPDRWKWASSEKITLSVNESNSHRSRNNFHMPDGAMIVKNRLHSATRPIDSQLMSIPDTMNQNYHETVLLSNKNYLNILRTIVFV